MKSKVPYLDENPYTLFYFICFLYSINGDLGKYNFNNISPLWQMQEPVHDIYSEEIKNFYQSKLSDGQSMGNVFLAMHSDYLNLEVQEEAVVAKSTFYDGDIIMEVRGKVVHENILIDHLQKLGKKQYDGCYGLLAWLDLKTKLLIRPIGISEALMNKSINLQKQENKPKGNCYIEEHFGSKLLVKASDIIPKGDKVIL